MMDNNSNNNNLKKVTTTTTTNSNYNINNEDGGENNNNNHNNQLLNHILPQLRPFQREAYEFAINGIRSNNNNNDRPICNIQDNNNDNNDDVTTTTVGSYKSNNKYRAKNPYRGSSSSSNNNNKQNNNDNNNNNNPNGRVLIADEMGLGKTITALAIACYYRDSWPLLIICPSSLRYQWPNEIEKFLPMIHSNSIYICNGFQDTGFIDENTTNTVKKHIQIVIITYSLFQNRSTVAQTIIENTNTKKNNNNTNNKKLLFNCIIVDESHNIKQKDCQRTKLLLPLLKQTKYLLLLSGTPALSKPIELYTQLYCLNALSNNSNNTYTNNNNFTTFAKRYCNPTQKHIGRGRYITEYNGASNIEELHTILHNVMIRRLKSSVLSELPPKQRTIIPIDIIVKEQQILCQNVIQEWKSKCKSNDENDIFNDFETKSALMRAYQQTGIGKAYAVAEYLTSVWLPGNSNGKILIFAHHINVLDTIEQAIYNYTKKNKKSHNNLKHIRIDGNVSSLHRQELVRQFQSNTSNCRIALLSMTAAGVGLTLTAASTIMFAELHWTPSILAQAEDRVHRIGQTASHIQILYMLCQNNTYSIDPVLWLMLGKKIHTLDQIVDGKKDRPYLFSAKTSKNDNNNQDGNIHHQSAQDELTEFFASTNNNGCSKKDNKPLVKGSIESFFQKASAAKKDNSMSNNNEKNAKTNKHRIDSLSIINDDIINNNNAVSTSKNNSNRITKVNHVHTENKNQFSWTCKVCTLDNTRNVSKNAYYPCQVCGELYTVQKMLTTTTATRISLSPKTKQQQDEVICVDDDSPVKTKLNNNTNTDSVDIIDVADDDDDDNSIVNNENRFASTTSKRTVTNNQLLFSVSKHTGRIFLHFSNQPEISSTLINFDTQDVITDESADQLVTTATRRFSNAGIPSMIIFCESGIDKITEKLKNLTKAGNELHAQYKNEIKQFISSYLNLREIEKKILKDSDEVVMSTNVNQVVAKIMANLKSRNGTVERYTGGAKERARENKQNGCDTELDRMILDGKACAWCAKPLSNAAQRGEATYCSEECAVEGRLRRGGRYASNNLRTAVFALERGKCNLCGIDAHSLFNQICTLQPPERLNKLLSVNWKLPKSSKALESLLQDPKEGNFWQVDHIKAVSEGGGDCGLENLRTLCVPCHTAETEKLRGRLQLKESSNDSDDVKNKRKQIDIRSMFSKAKKIPRN